MAPSGLYARLCHAFLVLFEIPYTSDILDSAVADAVVLFADTNNCIQFRVIQQSVTRASFKQRDSDYITPSTSKRISTLLFCISFL